jgi:DNA-directed RNA polymerase sigma subunit (sigma70/sigma32)
MNSQNDDARVAATDLRDVQVMHWWREGLTQREMGRRLGVSAERARQLLMRALRRHIHDDGEWGDYARYVLGPTQE